jgi:pyruvate dehydrogenase E2 component (dihydrolipoamide acetyltransferase)
MAASNVLLPQMGYDMTLGKILRWIKNEGDRVTKGDVIAEIETDKVNIEIEAFASGTLLKIVAPEGETIPVGQPIAVIGEPGESVGAVPPPVEELPSQQEGSGEGAEAAPTHVEVTAAGSEGGREGDRESAREGEREEAVQAQPAAEAEEERMKVSPVARRIAQEQGIQLEEVEGTGPGGRITKDDVERFLTEAASRGGAQRPAPRAPERPAPPSPAPARAEERPERAAPAPRRPEPDAAEAAPPRPAGVAAFVAIEGVPSETREVSRMGQAIARRMTQSKQTVPHFYATIEVDMSHAARLREDLNRTLPESERISFNDFVMKAAAIALTRVPVLNSTFSETRLTIYNQVNIAMAVALEQGLITPVLGECERKPLAQISREARDLASRVKEGKLRQEDYEGGTFTVTNLGMFGVEDFAAIINPPQAAILAVGAVAARPVVREGQLAVAQTMKATISVDHRAANGADGARYLQHFKEILEDPIRLLL